MTTTSTNIAGTKKSNRQLNDCLRVETEEFVGDYGKLKKVSRLYFTYQGVEKFVGYTHELVQLEDVIGMLGNYTNLIKLWNKH